MNVATWTPDVALEDFYLEAYRAWKDAGRAEPKPGWWHASTYGKCPQSLIRSQLGDVGDNAHISAKSRRTFAFGDELHRMKKARSGRLGTLVYPPAGSEWHLEDSELRCSGYIDRLEIWPPQSVETIPEDKRAGWSVEWMEFVTYLRERLGREFERPAGLSIVEDKSIKSSSMTYAPLWNSDGIGEPKPEHTLQVGMYSLIARRNPDQLPGPLQRGAIVYTGKDSGGVLEFDVDLGAAADLAQQRIAFLTAEFSKAETKDIACECEGWMCLYCNHRYLLEERTGPKGGRRIAAECCSGASFERPWRNGDESLWDH